MLQMFEVLERIRRAAEIAEAEYLERSGGIDNMPGQGGALLSQIERLGNEANEAAKRASEKFLGKTPNDPVGALNAMSVVVDKLLCLSAVSVLAIVYMPGSDLIVRRILAAEPRIEIREHPAAPVEGC